MELRSPDPSANPYLALALCLAAGLDGIENKMTPPKQVYNSIFAMSPEERVAAGIDNLPGSLRDSLDEFEKDPMGREVLGDHTYDKYLEAKDDEWNEYKTQVTQWEIDTYLLRY